MEYIGEPRLTRSSHDAAEELANLIHSFEMTTEPESSGEAKIKVVNEVPETLKRLTLMITKAFYGVNHFVLVDYLQRNICVKEDQLREVTKMDSKLLRQLLVQLKVDKIVKERVVPVETPSQNGGKGGKPRKVSYYFVNYKAVLNVARYKIDHMRQKLESREKNDVNKASYKCTREGCGHAYDALNVDQLMDLTTGEMRCWRCQSIVEPDRAAGPTDLTRTSLAKFNEQMAVLFSIMQSLDGIRLAQHLLEPPVQNITTESQEDDKNEKKFLQVGAKAFGGHHSSRKDMYNQEVTVNIIDGNAPVPVVQEKESVPWLSTDSNFDVNADLNPKPALGFASSSAPVLSYVAEEQQRMKARIHTAESFSRLPEVQALLKFEKDLLKEHEQKEEAVAAERPRGRVLFTLEEENYEPMDVDEQMDDEEYIQLTIQGHPVDFEEIAADPDLIKKMAQDELQLYIEVWREHMEY